MKYAYTGGAFYSVAKFEHSIDEHACRYMALGFSLITAQQVRFNMRPRYFKTDEYHRGQSSYSTLQAAAEGDSFATAYMYPKQRRAPFCNRNAT
jgi:hypothetical protein